MDAKSNEILPTEYEVNGRVLSFLTPVVMGIVNLTPDSFYDGGKYDSESDILQDVESKIRDGATIIDLGGASSRPGADEVPEEVEWQRLEAPLKATRKRFPEIFISVDTYRAAVAKKAADNGADIINDISGGRADSAMYDVVASAGVPYIAMHMDGMPATMRNNPPYEDIVRSVTDRFREIISSLAGRGFSKIILDPGFGFGKSLANNYQLLYAADRVCDLGFPVLAGLSRKSMISRVTGGTPVTALNGTTTLQTIALMKGVKFLRVHDVKEAVETIQLVEYCRNA